MLNVWNVKLNGESEGNYLFIPNLLVSKTHINITIVIESNIDNIIKTTQNTTGLSFSAFSLR